MTASAPTAQHQMTHAYLTQITHSLPRVSSPAMTNSFQQQENCTAPRMPPVYPALDLFAKGAVASGKLELACP